MYLIIWVGNHNNNPQQPTEIGAANPIYPQLRKALTPHLKQQI